MLGDQALERFLACRPARVLDIGSGRGVHAQRMRDAGLQVVTCDLNHEADVRCDYATRLFNPGTFDGIWCCHVLEHQRNVGHFLDKIRLELKMGGVLAITVPPLKGELVGGHVTLWHAGMLLYNLVLAGFDCAAARVGLYGYNVSVVVERRDAELPDLASGRGDLEALAKYFPVPVHQDCDGTIGNVRW